MSQAGIFGIGGNIPPQIPTQFNEDVGFAVPVANQLNIIGGASTGNPTINMNTFGSGNTVEIRLNNSISQPTTNAAATAGMYSLGGQPFMHNYAAAGLAAANTFLGSTAGNLTSTGVSNTGIGFGSLDALTTATHNTMVGSGSGSSITTSSLNVGQGWLSLLKLSTGSGQNVSIGSQSGSNLLTGAFNTFLGNSAGINYTSSESSNILIGSGVGGIAPESNTLRIGLSTGSGNQQLNRAFVQGIYGITPAIASPSIVVIDSAGQ